MTEPKVVHEWTDPTYGEQWKVFDGFPPHPVYMLDEVDGWLVEEDGPSLVATAKELARLAVRVQELEALQDRHFMRRIENECEIDRLLEGLEKAETTICPCCGESLAKLTAARRIPPEVTDDDCKEPKP